MVDGNFRGITISDREMGQVRELPSNSQRELFDD